MAEKPKLSWFTRAFSQEVKKNASPKTGTQIAKEILESGGAKPVIRNKALVDAVNAEYKAVSKNYHAAHSEAASAAKIVEDMQKALDAVNTTRAPVNKAATEYMGLRGQFKSLKAEKEKVIAEKKAAFADEFPRYKVSKPTKKQQAALDAIASSEQEFNTRLGTTFEEAKGALRQYKTAVKVHDKAKQLAPTAEQLAAGSARVTDAASKLSALKPDVQEALAIKAGTRDAAKRAGVTFSSPNLENNNPAWNFVGNMLNVPLKPVAGLTVGATRTGADGVTRAWGVGPTMSNLTRGTFSLAGEYLGGGAHAVPGSTLDTFLQNITSRYVGGGAAALGTAWWVGSGVRKNAQQDTANSDTIAADTSEAFTELRKSIYADSATGINTPEQFVAAMQRYYDNFSDDGTDNVGFLKSGVTPEDYGQARKTLRDAILSSPQATAYAQARASSLWDTNGVPTMRGRYLEVQSSPRNKAWVDKFHKDYLSGSATNELERAIFENYMKGDQ